MATDDTDYYARRAREERERAACCDDSSARRAHQELADRYGAKAKARDPYPALGDVA